MAETQEDADRQFALMLSREAYYGEDHSFYGLYEDPECAEQTKKKKRKSSAAGKDDEWNPTGRKPNKRVLKKTPIFVTGKFAYDI